MIPLTTDEFDSLMTEHRLVGRLLELLRIRAPEAATAAVLEQLREAHADVYLREPVR